MNNSTKIIAWLGLVCISILGSIYIVAPSIIYVYNILMFETFKIVLTKKAVLGALILLGITRYKKSEKETTPKEVFVKCINVYILCGMSCLIAMLYSIIL